MESRILVNLFIFVALVVIVPGEVAGNYEPLDYRNTYATYPWQRPLYRGIPQRSQRMEMNDDTSVSDFRMINENNLNATDDPDNTWPEAINSALESRQRLYKIKKDLKVPTYRMPVPVIFVSSYMKPKY